MRALLRKASLSTCWYHFRTKEEKDRLENEGSAPESESLDLRHFRTKQGETRTGEIGLCSGKRVVGLAPLPNKGRATQTGERGFCSGKSEVFLLLGSKGVPKRTLASLGVAWGWDHRPPRDTTHALDMPSRILKKNSRTRPVIFPVATMVLDVPATANRGVPLTDKSAVSDSDEYFQIARRCPVVFHSFPTAPYRFRCVVRVVV